MLSAGLRQFILQEKKINPDDTKNVKHIIWKLIRERLLEIEEERFN